MICYEENQNPLQIVENEVRRLLQLFCPLRSRKSCRVAPYSWRTVNILVNRGEI